MIHANLHILLSHLGVEGNSVCVIPVSSHRCDQNECARERAMTSVHGSCSQFINTPTVLSKQNTHIEQVLKPDITLFNQNHPQQTGANYVHMV